MILSMILPRSIGTTLSKAMSRSLEQKKNRIILGAAAEMFLEHGYAATSIEAIAKTAGVSKVTIYSHFRCKRGLFRETVQYECEKLRTELQWDQVSRSLRDELISFGKAMNEFFGRSELVRLERIVVAEIEENPELGYAFLDAGPNQVLLELVKLLSRAQKEGLIETGGVESAADQLAAMFLGLGELERRFGRGADIDEVTTRVVTAVSLFLDVYGCSNEAF